MSQSILRKRKIKEIMNKNEIEIMQHKLFSKRSIDLSGQIKYDYSNIISQITQKYPQISQNLIREILNKNDDDLIQVMNQVQQYVNKNETITKNIQEEDWSEQNEIDKLRNLVANSSKQNMESFFLELQKEVKQKFDTKDSEIYRKTQATNFILKEAVRIQKKNLDLAKLQEQKHQNEYSKLISQIQQAKLQKRILKQEIDSNKIQPQLIL